MAQYRFCHGWTVNPQGFAEITCKRRETCRYYDEDFYRHHGHHLHDFEEMFPFEPCGYYTNKND